MARFGSQEVLDRKRLYTARSNQLKDVSTIIAAYDCGSTYMEPFPLLVKGINLIYVLLVHLFAASQQLILLVDMIGVRMVEVDHLPQL